MRMIDMRLIVLIMLIVLSAAMPANCAEEPTIRSGLVTGAGTTAQARLEIVRSAPAPAAR